MKFHKKVGHGVLKKTLKWLFSRFNWGGMKDKTHQVLDFCLLWKRHAGPNPRFKHNALALDKPFHVVKIDRISSLPVAARGHQYIIIAVELLTKWVEAAYCSFSATKITALFLLCYILLWYVTLWVLLSDDGFTFPLQVVTELYDLFGTHTNLSSLSSGY